MYVVHIYFSVSLYGENAPFICFDRNLTHSKFKRGQPSFLNELDCWLSRSGYCRELFFFAHSGGSLWQQQIGMTGAYTGILAPFCPGFFSPDVDFR